MLGLGHKGPKTMLGLGHKGPKTISLGINSSVGAWAIQRPTSCSLQGVSMRPEGIASRRIRLQLGELEADHRPPHTVAVVQHPSQPGQCQPSRHVSRVLVLPGSTSSSQVASICSKAPRRSLRTRPADELAYVTGAQAGVPGTECRSLEVLYDADKTSAWSRMLQHDTLRNMTRAILGLLFRSTLGLINIGRCCGLGPGWERVLGGGKCHTRFAQIA